MIEKQLKRYKRKNELHAPFTAQCACSLRLLNQKFNSNSIKIILIETNKGFLRANHLKKINKVNFVNTIMKNL